MDRRDRPHRSRSFPPLGRPTGLPPNHVFPLLPHGGKNKDSLFRTTLNHHLRYLIRHFDSAYSAIEAEATSSPSTSASTSHPRKLGMAAYFHCLPGILEEIQKQTSLHKSWVELEADFHGCVGGASLSSDVLEPLSFSCQGNDGANSVLWKSAADLYRVRGRNVCIIASWALRF